MTSYKQYVVDWRSIETIEKWDEKQSKYLRFDYITPSQAEFFEIMRSPDAADCPGGLLPILKELEDMKYLQYDRKTKRWTVDSSQENILNCPSYIRMFLEAFTYSMCDSYGKTALSLLFNRLSQGLGINKYHCVVQGSDKKTNPHTKLVKFIMCFDTQTDDENSDSSIENSQENEAELVSTCPTVCGSGSVTRQVRVVPDLTVYDLTGGGGKVKMVIQLKNKAGKQHGEQDLVNAMLSCLEEDEIWGLKIGWGNAKICRLKRESYGIEAHILGTYTFIAQKTFYLSNLKKMVEDLALIISDSAI